MPEKVKFKVVNSGSKLKTAISKLTSAGAEFRALRGHEKTKSGKDDGPESIGLFVDAAAGSEFTKEKAKIANGQFFQGQIRPSTKDPKARLVLLTRNNPRPLLELARACLKDASVKHKIIAIQPDAVEPDTVDEDGDGTTTTTTTTPPTTTATTAPQRPSSDPQAAGKAVMNELGKRPATDAPGADLPPQVAQSQAELRALANFHGALTRQEAEAALAAAGPGKRWLLRWSANERQVVISFQEAGGTFKHQHTVSDDRSVGTPRDKVLSAMSGYEAVRQLVKGETRDANAGAAPTGKGGQTAASDWAQRLPVAKKAVLAVLERAAKSTDRDVKTAAGEVGAQLKAAEQAAASQDYARANTLLGACERATADLLKGIAAAGDAAAARQRYEKEKAQVDAMFNRLSKFGEVPAERLTTPRKLYDEGVAVEKTQDAKVADYERAIAVLQRARGLEKSILTNVQWARQIDIGKYSKEKALKAGAFGEVHLLKSDDPKAPTLVCKVPKTSDGAEEMKHEEEMYRKIGDHPNIARCLGRRDVDGSEALVMEAIKGGDMSKGFEKMWERLGKGEIKQEEFWGVLQFSMQKTLEALDHMATAGYSHVDIKPDNIMLDDETGEPKLVDMGLAAEAGTGGGGTAGFMSEANLMGNADGKADVFAVGATAFQGGENERFKYNRPQAFERGAHNMAWVFANTQFFENEEEAVHVDGKKDPSKPAARSGADPGQRQKEAGQHGAKTAYTDFLNWLMNPDPTKRPTAREALEHPFLKDSVLPPDRARELIRGLNK